MAANFAGCEKLLLDAEIQFALAHYNPSMASRLDKDRFQYIELGKDVLIPVSAPREKSSTAGGRRNQPAPLFALSSASNVDLPYLAYHPGSGIGRIVASFLSGKPAARRLVPSFSAPVMLLINMARGGRGITWAPQSLVADDLANRRLLRAGDKSWDIEIRVCLFRRRARMTPAAEKFWSGLKKVTPKPSARTAS